MSQGLGVQLGLGGGRSATSSGAPAGGGGGLANDFSINLDGVNDYLNLATVADVGTATAFSFSCWVYYPTGAQFNTGVFSCGVGGNRFWLLVGGSGQYRFYHNSTWVDVTLYTRDTWEHVAATHDGSDIIVYLNGEPSSPVSAPSLPDSDLASNFWIGYGPGGYRPWEGKLDEAAMWTSALTAQQVMNIAKGGTSTATKVSGDSLAVGDLETFSPDAWWRMGDSSGDTIFGGTAPVNDGVVGTVENKSNPGTYDGSGGGGLLYSTTAP